MLRSLHSALCPAPSGGRPTRNGHETQLSKRHQPIKTKKDNDNKREGGTREGTLYERDRGRKKYTAWAPTEGCDTRFQKVQLVGLMFLVSSPVSLTLHYSPAVVLVAVLFAVPVVGLIPHARVMVRIVSVSVSAIGSGSENDHDVENEN